MLHASLYCTPQFIFFHLSIIYHTLLPSLAVKVTFKVLQKNNTIGNGTNISSIETGMGLELT